MGHPQVLDEARPAAEEAPPRKALRDPDARLDPGFGRRPIATSSRPARPANAREAAIDRPSVGRSLRRAVYRFVLAVLVGVSGTLGWQSYGEQMLAAHAPTLAWLFSISPAKMAGVSATSNDTTQLAPLASNFEGVRRSLEQLAAKQDQMAQDIAALQAMEDDIRQKMSFMPPSPATIPPAASVLQPKLPQPKAQPSPPQPSAMQSPPGPRLPQAAGPAVR